MSLGMSRFSAYKNYTHLICFFFFFYRGVAAPVGSKDHCDGGRENIQYVNSTEEHVTVCSLHNVTALQA